MKRNWSKRVLAGLLVVSMWGCKVPNAAPSPYEQGAYVVNAGDPSSRNGSISFVPQNTSSTATDIFNAANGRSLMGVVQQYNEVNGKGVILVENSTAGQDKVEIVEIGTFKSVGTLAAPDVENPRYVVMAGPNKAYISCWGATGADPSVFPNAGYILVVNLASRTVTKKITVSKGANRMVVVGNEAFIGNVGGDRVLTVINTDTDEVQQPGIDVGVTVDPVAVDANGKLWAYVSSTKEMVRMNVLAKTVETRLKVGADPANPTGTPVKSPNSIVLSADRRTFFFINSFYDAADNNRQKGETYSFPVNATSIPATTPLINRLFSGLGVDPSGIIYAGVTPSYKQPGFVVRYRSNGVLIDSVRAEIAPTAFFFR